MDDPRVVYIAGYGRSGSTLLDIILGDHPAVASCGEMTYLYDDYNDPNRKCTCGNTYPRCPVWGQAGEDRLGCSISDARRIIRTVDGNVPFGRQSDPGIRQSYRRIMRSLFTVAAEKNGTGFIVDSSKTTREMWNRPIALSRIAGLPVKVIHLQRSLRPTMASIVKQDNWVAEGHKRIRFRLLRFLPSYWAANYAARRVRRLLGADAYHFVSYDALIRFPAQTIRGIGGFLGLDLEKTAVKAEDGGAFSAGHNVGGNRLRLQNSIVLKRI